MRKLGIEMISVYGLPPVQLVELAAELGCQSVSTVMEPLEYNPEGYPRYSLRKDPAMRRDLKKALADTGVIIGLAEGFVVRNANGPPDNFVHGDHDMGDQWAKDIEMLAELGVPLVNAIALDEDESSCFDQLAMFTELAMNNGLIASIEFCPGFGCLRDLPTALRAVDYVGDLRLLMDSMHLIRSGGTVADMAALDPALIAYAQLCDVPLIATNPDYIDEAMNERFAPGDRELPLVDFAAALPKDIVVGLEVPQKKLADAGIYPRERLAPVVAAARAVLAEAEAR